MTRCLPVIGSGVPIARAASPKRQPLRGPILRRGIAPSVLSRVWRSGGSLVGCPELRHNLLHSVAGPLQYSTLTVRKLEPKMPFDIRLCCSASLSVGNDRIGNNADAVPVRVFLMPIDLAQLRQLRLPIFGHIPDELATSGTYRTQHGRVRSNAFLPEVECAQVTTPYIAPARHCS